MSLVQKVVPLQQKVSSFKNMFIFILAPSKMLTCNWNSLKILIIMFPSKLYSLLVVSSICRPQSVFEVKVISKSDVRIHLSDVLHCKHSSKLSIEQLRNVLYIWFELPLLTTWSSLVLNKIMWHYTPIW